MSSNILKKKEIRLVSKLSSQLSFSDIKNICYLKVKQWKFGIKSQLKWYKINIKRNDIHNLLYLSSNLIGYTALRVKTCKIDGSKKKNKYFLFDTLIINKKYRNLKLSSILMNFNNFIIKQFGYFSYLICKKELTNFYTKFGWLKLKKRDFHTLDRRLSYYGMIFNQKKYK